MGIGLVLVPGAGLGAWIWRDVTPLLDTPAIAPEPAGRGVDDAARGKLSLEQYARHLETQVVRSEPERLVLVAHSLGGLVAMKAAQLLGRRVAGFVALSAVIPAGGGSFVSALPMPKRALMNVLIRTVGTKAPPAVIRKGIGDGLPAAVVDEIVERFTPESRRVFLDPVGVGPPAVPRLYVETTRDKEVDVRLQRRMRANLGTDAVRSIDSGHLPMLSHPREVAEILDGFVADLD